MYIIEPSIRYCSQVLIPVTLDGHTTHRFFSRVRVDRLHIVIMAKVCSIHLSIVITRIVIVNGISD